jgi:3alpha(or 20beta)-hydroxysteroid dehydrogenase
MGKLDGKVALVTGAARGQGEAEARAIVREGGRVVVADVLDDLASAVAADLGDRAVACHLDVGNPDEWSAAVDLALATFGRLDILVNNAGILRTGTIEHQLLDDFMAVIRVNEVGCWLGIKAVIPALRAAGGGSIVNISSEIGFIGLQRLSAYSASKFAIRGITKCAALELGHDNIRVNSVHPGFIDTDMARPDLTRDEKSALLADQPIARVGVPDDVANLVVFLASDDSSYSTGSEFHVNGGSLAGRTVTKV